jgi:hypothetical protein
LTEITVHCHNTPMDEKIRTKCQAALPLTDFYRNKQWTDDLHPWCKTCFNAASKARYEKRCKEHNLEQAIAQLEVHWRFGMEALLRRLAWL